MPSPSHSSSPSADAALRNPVGTHLKVGSGLVRGALARAEEIGAECFQVFVGNPRGWAASAGDPGVDATFRSAVQEAVTPQPLWEQRSHCARDREPAWREATPRSP